MYEGRYVFSQIMDFMPWRRFQTIVAQFQGDKNVQSLTCADYFRIKSFFGYTENAVRCQIWIALSVYLLVAILKRELKIERSIYEILQILSVTPFEKMSIISILEKTPGTKNELELAKHRFLWD